MFRRDLLQAVLKQATTLGLALNEVQRLIEQARLDDQAREADAGAGQGSAEQVDRRRGEAGRSGRILGREVWEAGT